MKSTWFKEFASLGFVDQHTVISSVAGTIASIVFGVVAILFSSLQLSRERREAAASRMIEINAKNQLEAQVTAEHFNLSGLPRKSATP